jgi:hypothetical protein
MQSFHYEKGTEPYNSLMPSLCASILMPDRQYLSYYLFLGKETSLNRLLIKMFVQQLGLLYAEKRKSEDKYLNFEVIFIKMYFQL